MKRARVVAAAVVLAAVAWYLHDPPWIAGVTSGLRNWEDDPPGTRFRWTSGHATFYVPSSAAGMTLPMRSVFPADDGRPVAVSIAVDGRPLTEVQLRDPASWTYSAVPLPRRSNGRRYRRVDLRISRVVGFYNLGIELGEIRFVQ